MKCTDPTESDKPADCTPENTQQSSFYCFFFFLISVFHRFSQQKYEDITWGNIFETPSTVLGTSWATPWLEMSFFIFSSNKNHRERFPWRQVSQEKCIYNKGSRIQRWDFLPLTEKVFLVEGVALVPREDSHKGCAGFPPSFYSTHTTATPIVSSVTYNSVKCTTQYCSHSYVTEKGNDSGIK